MFLDNKYTKWYYMIIKNSKNQVRSKNDGYFERHHIIPHSLGGTNEIDNLVLLTAKEHFICHLLLPKMCKQEYHYHKMMFALKAMGQHRGIKRAYCSRMYNYLRPKFSESISAIHKGKPKPGTSAKMKNKIKTEEHKRKISEGQKGKKRPHKLKTYEVISPSGINFTVVNRRAFCDEHGIKYNEFSRAASSGKQYKGWSIIPL